MARTLRDFYQDVKGEVIEEKPVAPVPGKYKPSGSAPSDSGVSDYEVSQNILSMGRPEPVANVPAVVLQDTAHQVIDAGKQYEELSGSHKGLIKLLDQAKSGNEAAMYSIVKDYGFEPNELEITITKPLRDAQGNEPEKFGIKLIRSEEEWAAITRDWETAAAYFPGIELHNMPTTRRGKRLAVVMGVGAKEFNAVIMAERRRENLEKSMRAYDNQIEQGRKEMGVDKMPRVPTAKDQKPPPETPVQAQEKSQRVVSLPSRK